MLPETSLPISEIMQTEDITTETLDEASTLIHSPDIEMTVKEEIEDHPVEACVKPSTTTTILLEECVVLQHDQEQPDYTDAVGTNHFSSSQDNQVLPQIITTSLQGELQASEDNQQCPVTFPHQAVSTTGPSGSEQKNERGRARGRRRSRWKLKFHHQALPPEYLDHYEASMAQQEAAAAAKSASIKSDNRGQSCGSTSAKPVPILAPRASPNDKSSTKQVVLPSQCFIKIEPDHAQFDSAASPHIANSNAIDHLHILPMQALPIGSENEILNRLQRDVNISNKDDISIINEKPAIISGKVNLNNSKGLLGSLLANTAGPSEMGGKNVSDIERKRRSSVIMTSASGGNMNNVTNSRSSTPATSIGNSSGNCSKVVNYQDLPYMGEITLDNMKPRRGRKPKKADICHLIYKNYGTIFPGTPNRSSQVDGEEWPRKKLQESTQNMSSLTSINSNCNTKVKSENFPSSNLKCKPFELLKSGGQINHSDVQNRIISSLLEKRLTAASQDAKKNIFTNVDFPSSSFDRNDTNNIIRSGHEPWNPNNKRTSMSTSVSDEPLNLCVKDLNQLKIRLLRKHGNFYEPRTNDVVSVKSEPPSLSDIEELELHDTHIDNVPKFLQESVRHENRTSLPFHRQESENVSESFPFPVSDCSTTPTTPLLPIDSGTPTGSPLPGGYIYWPSAGVFVHPMALQSQLLYYQKMGAIPLVPISPADQAQAFLPSPLPQVNLTSHVNNPATPSSSQIHTPKSTQIKEQKSCSNKTQIPKAVSMMMDASTKSYSMPSEITFPRMKRLAPLGNPPTVGTPTKRKRSAIFIPPMPSENSTNPTTEVSICKFKFTGGAKPTLQEKKMLSVDSGGNFRYYSGTGDKSMRGYEFFPRESLQQPSGSTVGSSSEQFLAASALGSGEKVMGNSSLTFIPEENRSGHLKQLSGLTETITKVGLDCSQPSSEMGDKVDSNSQLYDHQNPGVSSIRKKSDFIKGRPFPSGSDGDRFGQAVIPGDDEQNSHSQFRLRRKRKTRKSLAREKLEQTFKEKGFLIQTQQLESAEGATYCKFRQLRKFTRYLFRSWKDYLPGNVREMSVAAGVAGSDASPPSEGGQVDSEVEGEISSSNSPTPSTPHQVIDGPQQHPNS